MGGQRGQRVTEPEVSGSSGGPAVSPADYGSNDFMAAYLRATGTPKQRCEEDGIGGLSVHTPQVDGHPIDADFAPASFLDAHPGPVFGDR